MAETSGAFDRDAAQQAYMQLPEFRELAATTPDALDMVTATAREAALVGTPDYDDFWLTIGEGEGGFYDDIRKFGCTNCESHTPGCCDACA